MITADYVRTMTAYNAEINDRLFATAARLPDMERRADRGAFWRSIHGTFSHLLWADRMWMSRFTDWQTPTQTLPECGTCYDRFDAMAHARREVDARLAAWAADLDEAWLGEEQSWFSGATGMWLRSARTMLVLHMFNHQTHHRGQVHAMLTSTGETTGDTDLLLVLPGAVTRGAGRLDE